MGQWEGLVGGFIAERAAQGVRDTTLEKYGSELYRLGLWLHCRRPRPSISEVTRDTILSYLIYRSSFKAKSTVYSTVSMLRCFGAYATRQGAWAVDPMRWIRGPKLDPRQRLPKRIGQEEMRRLWETAAAWPIPYYRYLWVAVMSLLYGTGIRRGELERLDLRNWDRDEGLLLVDGRKTGQERRLPVPGLVQASLDVYLPQRQILLERLGRIREPALFVNQNGARLPSASVSISLRRIASRAGLPRITLHQFRHTCASDLLESGVHMAEVQRILGHQVITSTARYIEITDRQRHEAVAKHPVNGWLTGSAA